MHTLLCARIQSTPHYTTTQSHHLYNQTFPITGRKWEMGACSAFKYSHSKDFIYHSVTRDGVSRDSTNIPHQHVM